MKTIILIAALLSSSMAHGKLIGKAELLQAVSGESDLADWTRGNGINLTKLIENCLDDRDGGNQIRAWKLLVYFFHTFGADGAAGEELSMIGPSISKLVGDKRLLNILEEIPEEHWENGIPFGLLWRFNYPSLSDAEKLDLKVKHPTVYRNLERRLKRQLLLMKPNAATQPADKAKQDSADKPATAPQSKPEDNSKPKPESKGRP